MRITILTIFPEVFEGFINSSIIGRAIKSNKIEINVIDFRKYTLDKNNRVDDYPYGGGAGMVLMCQPVLDCLKDVKKENSYVMLTSPVGNTFNQKMAHELALKEDLVIICGHYEGYDERIDHYVDQKVSIGDYILTGGESAAMVMIDAISRLCDGVINQKSTVDESFENDLLEYPQYTRPEIYENMMVPEVLLSGHHENIRKYRLKESLRLTYLNRKDLIENKELNKEEKELLEEIIKEEHGN